MEGYGQARRIICCCRCYWSDQCCSGCGVDQEDCDDFTPLYDEDDYIEEDRSIDYGYKDGCIEDIEDCYSYKSFNDEITDAWLRGEDTSDKKWW